MDYTQTRVKSLNNFSAHEGSPALVQIAPFLKGFGALNTFSLFECLGFKPFQTVDEHQVEQQSKLSAGFSRLTIRADFGCVGLVRPHQFFSQIRK